MVAQQEVPPSWRDLQVYRLVKVEQRSTRGAADVMQLSQTRVCQIVARVGEFLIATAPGSDDEEQRRRQMHVATQLAAERIEFLHNQALNGFRSSQTEKVTLRKESVLTGQPEFDRRRTPGDPRFLMAAARLAMYAAKLPSPGMDFAALHADLLTEGTVEDDMPAEQKPATEANSPPKEACSATQEKGASAANTQPASSTATSCNEESCVPGVSADLLAKLRSTEPVQQPGYTDRVLRREDVSDLALLRRQRLKNRKRKK